MSYRLPNTKELEQRKNKQLKKSRALAAIIFVAASMALLAQLQWGKSSGYSERILEKAITYYNNGEKSKALDLLEPKPDQFIGLRDGCNMLISIFAEYDKIEALEKTSTACIEEGGGSGIAYEGYAKSLASQGRGIEAIMTLEKQIRDKPNPRIYGAIAGLYLQQKDFEGVSKSLLEAINIATPWAPWVNRAIETKALAEDPKFMAKLIEAISKKKDHFKPTEDKVLAIAKKLGLSEQIEKLNKRRG